MGEIMIRGRRWVKMLRAVSVAAVVLGTSLTGAASASALPPVRHVFVIVDENESAATTFGPNSPAPYLSKTLVSQGSFLPNYYGIGHSSLDNYIAMVSGQAPNPKTSADCGTFADFAAPTSMDASGQETGQGCVYPADVPSLMSQLDDAGLTWRAYEDSMGADPSRESATCGPPAVGSTDNTESQSATDQYATRHDPFVYFHYVIDDAAECNADVVNLNQLSTDLSSAATTPSYSFITPGLCDDGHDSTCMSGNGAGGLPQADTFLKTWVPTITGSPAFKQDGLLIVLFDEAVGDATACCGEMPGPFDAGAGIQSGGSGPGGGDVGAVLLSPFITPGVTTSTPYNPYSMLATVEDLFGLPRLGGAAQTAAFGNDVFVGGRPASSPAPTSSPAAPSPPAPTPAPPSAPGPTAPAPLTPVLSVAVVPRDSGLRISPGAFRVSRKTSVVIAYSDSQAATSTLTVSALRAGYQDRRHRCVALTPGHRAPRLARACTVAQAVGHVTHHDTSGHNRVAFDGHLHGRALAAGHYVLAVTPTLAGVAGTTVTARFQVRR